MPYREKIAWLSLVGMAVCYGPYFAYTFQSPLLDQPLPNLPLMALFAAAAGGNAVWTVLGRLLVRMKTPVDERGPADERDLAVERRARGAAYYVLVGLALYVERRARGAAYYVLVGLALYVGGVMPFTSSGWHIVNSMVASVVIAETVSYATIVLGYRRGLP